MNRLVIADADALVALSLENDPHYQKAVKISQALIKQSATIIYPVTVFPEAITFLKRALNQSQKAHAINKKLQDGVFNIEYIDANIFTLATKYFDQASSKKNTFFDAIVAATAKSLKTDSIFSFDDWYSKLGFKLAGE